MREAGTWQGRGEGRPAWHFSAWLDKGSDIQGCTEGELGQFGTHKCGTKVNVAASMRSFVSANNYCDAATH